MKPRTEDDARAHSRRQAARAFIEQNGPLPEQPPLESRTCAHAGAPRPCSCHLTLAQIAAAEELGTYTLYVFGVPYTGRLKVPFYPGAGAADEVHVAIRERHEALVSGWTGPDIIGPDYVADFKLDHDLTRPTKTPVAPAASSAEQAPVAPAAPAPASAASRPKRAFDPIYNAAYAKARRRGAEAVATFKAEWAAKKAAA